MLRYAERHAIFSFAIISLRIRELVALLQLSYCCLVTVSVLCLFLMMSWVDLQCGIVIVPGHCQKHLMDQEPDGIPEIFFSKKYISADYNKHEKLTFQSFSRTKRQVTFEALLMR